MDWSPEEGGGKVVPLRQIIKTLPSTSHPALFIFYLEFLVVCICAFCASVFLYFGVFHSRKLCIKTSQPALFILNIKYFVFMFFSILYFLCFTLKKIMYTNFAKLFLIFLFCISNVNYFAFVFLFFPLKEIMLKNFAKHQPSSSFSFLFCFWIFFCMFWIFSIFVLNFFLQLFPPKSFNFSLTFSKILSGPLGLIYMLRSPFKWIFHLISPKIYIHVDSNTLSNHFNLWQEFFYEIASNLIFCVGMGGCQTFINSLGGAASWGTRYKFFFSIYWWICLRILGQIWVLKRFPSIWIIENKRSD